MSLVISEDVYIWKISEVIKEKPKPAPERKVRVTDILAWYVLHLESQIYPNSMMILSFLIL